MANEFDDGMMVGLLIGEGHFGGDGRQPQVTLRMHERHEALFRWLERTYPGGRLYGPYDHGGRHYYQWMARGVYLREELVPMLRRRLAPTLDRYAFARFAAMCERYRRQLNLGDPASQERAAPAAPESRGVRSEGLSDQPDGHTNAADDPEETQRSRASRIFTALRGDDTPPPTTRA